MQHHKPPVSEQNCWTPPPFFGWIFRGARGIPVLEDQLHLRIAAGWGYLGYQENPFTGCNWRSNPDEHGDKHHMEPADLTLKHPKGAHSGRNHVGFGEMCCFHNSRQLSKHHNFQQDNAFQSDRQVRVIIWVHKISNSRQCVSSCRHGILVAALEKAINSSTKADTTLLPKEQKDTKGAK